MSNTLAPERSATESQTQQQTPSFTVYKIVRVEEGERFSLNAQGRWCELYVPNRKMKPWIEESCLFAYDSQAQAERCFNNHPAGEHNIELWQAETSRIIQPPATSILLNDELHMLYYWLWVKGEEERYAQIPGDAWRVTEAHTVHCPDLYLVKRLAERKAVK